MEVKFEKPEPKGVLKYDEIPEGKMPDAKPKTVKVRVVDDLVDVIDDFFGGTEGHRDDPQFLSLARRIQGNVIEVRFTCGDAFEVIDNNYWLPDCCWIPEPTEVQADVEGA